MCRIFAGPSSSRGIPCEAAHLVLVRSARGLSGLRWGGGLFSADDGISPSLHNRINLTNTNTLSDVNLMMARVGRNM